ncbi:MFS transporter [Psychromicrobium lacuslunae]|uniref:MFS transporter n=2 Tax=Psychromicrobium lacuslunae TaxID=1618207 RepID=A0A0D4BZ90_9MICC|nr:MFS transporter [Psychromicrobium lacuslunae]
MLGLAVFAQLSSSIVVNGMAFLIPQLRQQWNLDLVQSGVLVAMPLAGTMLTLVAWGAVLDRIGERLSLAVALAASTVCLIAAAFSESPVLLGGFLFLAGAATGCTNSAGGRVVVGWFPAQQRGLAMGIRQMAQPLGVALASLLLPAVADGFRIQGALGAVAIIAAAATVSCWLGVQNPARRARRAEPSSENPYLGSNFLVRIHLVSAILVIPQFTIWTFSLLWLMNDRQLPAALAGGVIALAQFAGALGRIAVGIWSDRLGSRVLPLRLVSLAAAAALLLLALTDWLNSPWSIALLVVASVITVADNGLAFTSVAEISGPYWSGRALGIQNTGQYLVSAVVPPAIGGLIGLLSFPATFAIVALAPLAATPLVPSRVVEQKASQAAA